MATIERIAIINRGEAAMRGVRAIKELRAEEGARLTAIALYTEPERNAPFVRQADVAISLGPALRGPRGTALRPAYLDRARVLAALRATRADSAWPGWGFLAEDAAFVAQLEQRGITFIGPRSETIRTLGNKIAAKHLAASAGIPVAPWSGGPVAEEALPRAAAALGFPLVIKAAAGGGGRGIRIVTNRDELADAFAHARAEAAHACGDDTVFLEAFLPRPRHLEVQIAADHTGRCLALGLRDCSVQRRHQKVIEEAPPPHLSATVAHAMAEAAVRLARAVDYTGLGTVEFLLDAGAESFYFLEFNPRLQVEHGLTEALTGLDLVKLQIRLARGDTLPSTPPVAVGHAMEARLCAEQPGADFAPSPGTVVLVDLPSGPGIRTDCGVVHGSLVPAEFDPVIAKIIAHAPTREAARARLVCALADLRLVLAGGATNKGLLLTLLEHGDLRRGGVDVQWLSRTLADLPPPPHAAEALMAAAILAYLHERAAARLNFLAEAANGVPHSIPRSGGQTVELTYAGHAYRLAVFAIGDWGYRIRCDGRECLAKLLEQEPHACRLVINEHQFAITHAASEAEFRIEVNGQLHVIGRETGGLIRASAPSVVVALDVAPGDRVEIGQRLGLLETMKMEIAFTAPIAGTIKRIHVRRNQRVAAGAVLITLQPEVTPTVSSATGARLALPEWEDPLALLFTPEGTPDLARLARQEVPVRERALQALVGNVRRILLGYDVTEEEIGRLLDLLGHPLPPGLGPGFLQELAAIRQTVTVFADTELLFCRQPQATSGAAAGRSNDAWLRLYLRRLSAHGAGVDAAFLERLRQALRHYGLADLEPCDALERAMLRLYAARTSRADRYRLIGAVLQSLTRMAGVGVDFSDDGELNSALGACLTLRGTVPGAVADAAAEARYVMFELPHMRRQAAAATAAVEQALHALGQAETEVDLETLSRIADSPALIFDHIAAWLTEPHPVRRNLALQALVLREYAPLVPTACRSIQARGVHLARLEFAERGVVLAATAKPDALLVTGDALGQAAATEVAPPAVEILLPVATPPSEDALRAWVQPLLAGAANIGQRLCVSALTPGGAGTHLTYEQRDRSALVERTDLLGLHPETARRIDLARLGEFALERLPSSEGVYAFFGRSRRIPDDARIFILGEVRAAVPGGAGTLHEPAFVHAFSEAVRALRNIRGERDRRRHLYWNRITLFVRPAMFLLPATLDRLIKELVPATRTLGLEKIVIRLALRPERGSSSATVKELVVEPSTGGRIEVNWREPHSEPLRPVSRYERRLVRARRRGIVDPYEVIRIFTGPGAGGSGTFEEFDLDRAEGTAVSVRGRPPGENRCAVVFGIITTPTEKHPEGMSRVLVVSDPTRDMGALACPECERLLAALDLAAARGLPVEWVAVCGGVRIAMDSGTENLDAAARVVRRIVAFTEGGGEINVIVAGINVGAQSYFDALSTMLLHTRGALVMLPGASMVLTGRLALEVSGGVSAEDEVGIGGYERIMGPNGQAQYYARDLADAYDILLQHYRYTYVAPGECRPRRHRTTDRPERSITEAPYPLDSGEDFHTVGEIFDDAANPGRKRPFAMRPVMEALIDQDGGWLERWTDMAGGAETAIVWDAHLGGHPICLIGIESRNALRFGEQANDGPDQWTGGTLFPLSSKKVARAINAASGNRPIIVLANLSGFDGSPESMRKLQLEYGAEIARAVVNFVGPILFVVVSRYHGGAYVVFSRALNPGLYAVAFEGAFASVIGGVPAATVVFSREVRERTDVDPRVTALREQLKSERGPAEAAELRDRLERLIAEVAAEKQAEVAREFDATHTAERACAVGSLDAVVSPHHLRRLLIERLDSLAETSRNQSAEARAPTSQPPRAET